ncbi:class I SAM-dependent methyltransferase [Gramella sp. GC03-9]|uniref:Class I SAM-dependent methyltransferase n=1 Tax=Christiangramia oceanisediminis TaxID=2920386 RepID=A0A9X2I1V2_9FLAO|nr:class I SAM-dependent methyltransferase [Gramella oceanisediminis]MCP9198325.1 class I SAM-dependent methyltransferase [Gramella oceanisediminis]
MDGLNLSKNKDYYEKLYANYGIKNILYWVENHNEFLNSAITTETSWFALYQNGFKKQLEKGPKVLELGCGNCINAAIMARLGAEVYANDIADSSGIIIDKINRSCNFKYPIKFVQGNFLHNELPSSSFDLVVGKAFLHHLDISTERDFIQEAARLLKPKGEARFFEPAVNNKFVDLIRWYVPVPGRPSKFKKNAFRDWKNKDPHPDRDFSSGHFTEAGYQFFNEVEIIPVGSIERLSRFMSWGKSREKFRAWALKMEKSLPKFLSYNLARGQLVIYKNSKVI